MRQADETRVAGITLDQVVASVCEAYRLDAADLRAPGKAQPAAEARAVAAYLVRNAGGPALSELAGFLNRDLSGLSQAALRIERRIGMDDLLRERFDRLAEI